MYENLNIRYVIINIIFEIIKEGLNALAYSTKGHFQMAKLVGYCRFSCTYDKKKIRKSRNV